MIYILTMLAAFYVGMCLTAFLTWLSQTDQSIFHRIKWIYKVEYILLTFLCALVWPAFLHRRP